MPKNIESAPTIQFDDTPRSSKSDIERQTAHATRLRSERKFGQAARALAEIAALLPHEWLAQHNAGAVFLEANQTGEAIEYFARAVALHPTADTCTLYAHALALGGENSASRAMFERAVALDPRHFDAHWGLFEVDQLLDDNDAALEHQALALAERSIVTIEARSLPARTTILELCIAGTFQANIPFDFIVDLDGTTVHKLYLGKHPIPELPTYDIVFNTIADAPNAGVALRAAEAFIASQGCPALNAPRFVPLTSRDAVAERFADSKTIAVAPTRQANRMTIHAVRPAFPFLIRPLDSHAGYDLARIDDADALHAYLDAVRHEEFYLSNFVDYRNADGFYRKYRVVFVDGTPYPVHLAISPRWMIHYYNAAMAENAWMRDEEHAFMRDMDSVFHGTAADALREMAAGIPLDYFGIDCTIASDGRVLLFEASTAMIVHMRDPIEVYPYKVKYVPRVIAALERLFDKRLGRGAQS
jgi:tetratricopeptide (TPR) repeat protein